MKKSHDFKSVGNVDPRVYNIGYNLKIFFINIDEECTKYECALIHQEMCIKLNSASQLIEFKSYLDKFANNTLKIDIYDVDNYFLLKPKENKDSKYLTFHFLQMGINEEIVLIKIDRNQAECRSLAENIQLVLDLEKDIVQKIVYIE